MLTTVNDEADHALTVGPNSGPRRCSDPRGPTTQHQANGVRHMEHTATLQSVPSIQELDAAWPRVKDRVRKAEQRVLDVAWQVVEYPSDSGYRQDLEQAVNEH